MPIYALDDLIPQLPADGRYWIAPDANIIGKVRLEEDASVWFGCTLRGDREWIVVGAHHDHVGMFFGPGDTIFNGADDNASGVAALLMIAASLKQAAPRHDVILAVVDGEEGGMRGSRAMVADPGFKPLLGRTEGAVVARHDPRRAGTRWCPLRYGSS